MTLEEKRLLLQQVQSDIGAGHSRRLIQALGFEKRGKNLCPRMLVIKAIVPSQLKTEIACHRHHVSFYLRDKETNDPTDTKVERHACTWKRLQEVWNKFH